MALIGGRKNRILDRNSDVSNPRTRLHLIRAGSGGYRMQHNQTGIPLSGYLTPNDSKDALGKVQGLSHGRSGSNLAPLHFFVIVSL